MTVEALILQLISLPISPLTWSKQTWPLGGQRRARVLARG